MVELKREYVIPLRRKTNLVPKWRRSKKAISVLTDFVKKHMKTDNVIICKELNEKIWTNGIKNPPGKVSVVAFKGNFAGVEKTIVNLVEVGIDSHLELYKSSMPQVKSEKPVVDSDKKSKVKDAEVKEVKPEPKTEKVDKPTKKEEKVEGAKK